MGFFEEKNKKETIEFEIDSQTKSFVDNSIIQLGMKKDDLFKEFVAFVYQKTYEKIKGKSLKESNNAINIDFSEDNKENLLVCTLSKRIDNNVTKRRFIKWVREKEQSTPYQILYSYFYYYDKCDYHEVTKTDMFNYFSRTYYPDSKNLNEITNKFNNAFRQMSCASTKAHGLIFEYKNANNSDLVVLHPLNEKFVLSYKDKILNK